MRNIKRKNQGKDLSEDGQSLVEFALILPILLLLLLGIIEFGWRFMSEITVTNSVRETVRYAAVNKLTDGNRISTLTTEARKSLPDNLSINQLSTTFPGDSIRVEIKVNFQPITNFFGSGVIVITRSAEMRIEYN